MTPLSAIWCEPFSNNFLLCETVLAVPDVPLASIEALLARYDLTLQLQADNEAITGSFWGDSEAGIVGQTVFVRNDTSVHSLRMRVDD